MRPAAHLGVVALSPICGGIYMYIYTYIDGRKGNHPKTCVWRGGRRKRDREKEKEREREREREREIERK